VPRRRPKTIHGVKGRSRRFIRAKAAIEFGEALMGSDFSLQLLTRQQVESGKLREIVSQSRNNTVPQRERTFRYAGGVATVMRRPFAFPQSLRFCMTGHVQWLQNFSHVNENHTCKNGTAARYLRCDCGLYEDLISRAAFYCFGSDVPWRLPVS
jgi:hypothetical protein